MAEFSTYAALLDRTVATLRRTLRDLGVTARDTGAFTAAPDLPDGDSERLRKQLVQCLNGRGGEVSARARAVELGRTYLALNRTVVGLRRRAFAFVHLGPPRPVSSTFGDKA